MSQDIDEVIKELLSDVEITDDKDEDLFYDVDEVNKEKMERPTGRTSLTVTYVRKEPRLGIKNLMIKVMVLQVCKTVILTMLEKRKNSISSSMKNMT